MEHSKLKRYVAVHSQTNFCWARAAQLFKWTASCWSCKTLLRLYIYLLVVGKRHKLKRPKVFANRLPSTCGPIRNEDNIVNSRIPAQMEWILYTEVPLWNNDAVKRYLYGKRYLYWQYKQVKHRYITFEIFSTDQLGIDIYYSIYWYLFMKLLSEQTVHKVPTEL